MIETTAKRRQHGMTLLELMAVVMVIGVLGMIAIPSYRQYTMRAQRAEAKAALLLLQTNQERFYLTNRIYSADPDQLGFAGDITERGAYALTIEGADATGYTARARPRSGGAIDMTNDAQCTEFSITAQGVRSATGTTAANCW
ncbi:MAG TPA: type IV pilin protein [Gammaproteobacteria bacterium]